MIRMFVPGLLSRDYFTYDIRFYMTTCKSRVFVHSQDDNGSDEEEEEDDDVSNAYDDRDGDGIPDDYSFDYDGNSNNKGRDGVNLNVFLRRGIAKQEKEEEEEREIAEKDDSAVIFGVSSSDREEAEAGSADRVDFSSDDDGDVILP